ncbi:MAG: SRPBCC family protein [Abditibacteriaceae bacterium]
MAKVESTVIVEAPLETLWQLAQQVEKMPEYMSDLESVEALEDEVISPSQRRTKTRWVALIKQMNRKVRWVEEDIWDNENHLCTFTQTEGDFSEYSGKWHFESDGDQQTKAHLEISYIIEIPLLGTLIQKIILKLMQGNCDNMLDCLKAEAEK